MAVLLAIYFVVAFLICSCAIAGAVADDDRIHFPYLAILFFFWPAVLIGCIIEEMRG